MDPSFRGPPVSASVHALHPFVLWSQGAATPEALYRFGRSNSLFGVGCWVQEGIHGRDHPHRRCGRPGPGRRSRGDATVRLSRRAPIEVAAPANRVFAFLNDLHRFVGVWVVFGSTRESLDSQGQKAFEGPAAGVGQSYAWSGKGAGKGTLAIEESVPGHRVGMKLVFVEPMASTATVAPALAGAATGSLVTWSMQGNHNLLGRVVGLFMDMDKALGADMRGARSAENPRRRPRRPDRSEPQV